MSNSSSRIGSTTTPTASTYTTISQTAEGAAARASAAPRSGGGSSGAPNAGRGRVERVTTSPQSADQLDRSAPRGTYVNILA